MSKIIVELCQNHLGDRKVLREMIYRAKDAGADIIKGQIIFSEDLVPRERFDVGHVEDNGVRKAIFRPHLIEYERLKKLDMSPDDYHYFVEEVYNAGAEPMLTVFSLNRIPLATNLPWKNEKKVKIASYDCASTKLLHELHPYFDMYIVSTGATLNDEIKKTASQIKNLKRKLTYLHCVTSYPNTLSMCNLRRMEWLRQYTPEIGWSDHTLVARDGLKAAKVASALGADYIERHFTVLPSEKTKDGPVSITPEMLAELREFVDLPREEQMELVKKDIPEFEVIRGVENREMTHTEMLNRDYYRGRFGSLKDGKWINNW